METQGIGYRGGRLMPNSITIPKNALITDSFKCSLYPDHAPISYKFCISRQLTKNSASGGFLYPECSGCAAGQAISKHFKGYQHTNKKVKIISKVKPEFKKKKKKSRKGENPFSRHYIGDYKITDSQVSKVTLKKGQFQGSYDKNLRIGTGTGKDAEPENSKQTLYDLEFLIKAQVAYIFQLASEGKLNRAIGRIKLLNNELEE